MRGCPLRLPGAPPPCVPWPLALPGLHSRGAAVAATVPTSCPPPTAAQKGSPLPRTLRWPWATGIVRDRPPATSCHRGNSSREGGLGVGAGTPPSAAGLCPLGAVELAARSCGSRSGRLPAQRPLDGEGCGARVAWATPQAGRQAYCPSKVHTLSSTDTCRGHRARARGGRCPCGQPQCEHSDRHEPGGDGPQ